MPTTCACPFSCTQLVGGGKPLGSWQVQDAVELEWTPGNVWVGEVALPAGKHEFKVRCAG